MNSKKPEITVFAGPNGSGKSTMTAVSPHRLQPYINADDIKKSNHCSDIEAAEKAEKIRCESLVSGYKSNNLSCLYDGVSSMMSS